MITEEMIQAIIAENERLQAVIDEANAQEPVCKIIRNEAGQVSIKNGRGDYFDISKYVGFSLFAHPIPAQQSPVIAKQVTEEDAPNFLSYSKMDLKAAWSLGWNERNNVTSQQSPAVAVPDEPKNPGAAYLQTFLNDSRFDQAVNLMPDHLIEKFYSRIAERTADRDDWKLVCENLEEDIATLKSSPRITGQDASADSAFNCYLESLGGADSNEWHDAPADDVFKAGFKAGNKSTSITEAQAMEIASSAMEFAKGNPAYRIKTIFWLEEQGRALLAKLNKPESVGG